MNRRGFLAALFATSALCMLPAPVPLRLGTLSWDDLRKLKAFAERKAIKPTVIDGKSYYVAIQHKDPFYDENWRPIWPIDPEAHHGR